MRGANVLVILLVVGLLVFGCASPTPPAKPNDSGAPPSGGSGAVAPSGSGTGDSSGTTPGDGTVPQDDDTSGDDDQSGGNGQADGDDLTGKGYDALAALGVPLECDITMNSTTMKVYMKGSDEVRGEVPIDEQGATCRKMVSIMEGGKYYAGCSDGTLYPQCDWLYVTDEDSQPSADTSTDTPDYDSVPPADISCKPWLYDASKFATPGKVCSLDDLMQQYQQQYSQGNYPSGYE